MKVSLAWLGSIIGVVGALWAGADYLDVRPVLKKELIAEDAKATTSIINLQQTTQQSLGAIQQQLADTADSVLLLQFYALLSKKQQNGMLTFEDQAKLCQIASQLHFSNVPGC